MVVTLQLGRRGKRKHGKALRQGGPRLSSPRRGYRVQGATTLGIERREAPDRATRTRLRLSERLKP
ncbi:hypothetical protein BJV78DRAFT_1160147 [Lactifluus subvellereus]|nr:hypothetical protein BJV78DRAFT_1160147 [Lactifluus subvellereus]